MRRLCLLIGAMVVAAACSEPPRKEMDHAQGAIDAARSAGAEEYAADTFRAASSALAQSEAAVAQRDYRLALSLAIDASERASAAAKEAADGKARARGEVERTTAILEGATKDLQARVAAAEAARTPARDLEAARTTLAEADAALQEAREALAGGDYRQAGDRAKLLLERIREQIRLLEEARSAKPPPRRRR